MFVLITSSMMLGSCVTGPAEDSTASSAGSGTVAAPGDPYQTDAAGAASDTLKACLARIPKDASVGQRMIAERSCERDQADRR